jgi:hypothetical protein
MELQLELLCTNNEQHICDLAKHAFGWGYPTMWLLWQRVPKCYLVQLSLPKRLILWISGSKRQQLFFDGRKLRVWARQLALLLQINALHEWQHKFDGWLSNSVFRFSRVLARN